MSANSMATNVAQLLASRDIFDTLDFAKFIGAFHDVELLVPSEEIEPLYIEARQAIDDGMFVTRSLEAFIDSGLAHMETVKRRAKETGKPMSNMRLSAHSVNRIKEFLTELQLDNLPDLVVPDYLAGTYIVENEYGSARRYSAYWKWSTVDVQYIDRQLLPAISKLAIEYEQAWRENRIASVNVVRPPLPSVDNIPSLNELPKKVVTLVSSVALPETVKEELLDEKIDALRDELEFQQLLQREVNENVKFSMFTARRYLDKVHDAYRRGIEFSLTIEDFAALMRHRVCHFTNVPLVVDIGEQGLRERRIPDNYLSLDRLDSNLGYHRNNVVVCAHSVNVHKNRMSEQQFKQLTSMVTLMSSLSEEQRTAMQGLMNMNLTSIAR